MNYCNDHPLGSFNEAVMDVYFRLQNSDYPAELSKVVDSYARVLQAVEFEERLSKLEKALQRDDKGKYHNI